MERRQQPLGPGLVTQAIIVTCHDNDDAEESQEIVPDLPLVPPQGARRISPPLSLIAPIMKMLAARARARSDRPQPQIFQASNNGPFPFPCSPNGPFPCPSGQPKPIITMSGPFIRKEIVMKAPAPVMKSPGPISGPISGAINGPISGPINGPISGPFPGPRPSPFSGPIPGPIPMPGPMRGPIRVPFGGPLSSRIISGPLPIQSRRDGPFPFGVPRPIPLPASQALSKPQDEEDEEPRHRMLPFPFRPAVRMSPRFLPIVNLSPPAPELRNPPVPISSLRRGAVKIEDLPRPLPEAKGRALSSPVPLKFLPGRLLNSTPCKHPPLIFMF